MADRVKPEFYQLASTPGFVLELPWLSAVPDSDPDYLAWLNEGNTPAPAEIREPIAVPDWERFREALILSPEWNRIEDEAPGKASRLFNLLWRFNEKPDIPALVGATWLQLVQAASITPEEIAVFRQVAIDCHMPPAIVQLLGG